MNNLKNEFNSLIKTLILLKSPYEEQIEYSGNLIPFGEDVVGDFEAFYCLPKKDFVAEKFLNKEQIKKLDELDNFLTEKSYNESDDFWTDYSILKSHPDWEIIRKLARECLGILEKENLYLEIKKETQEEKTENGENIIIERIKIELTNGQLKM